ncbi:hypothetical protein [Haloarcula onubensis]|uniref:Methyl-accepting chemotaxis protein n=1 Tax=Haloarcula onubensis TaxID=2950539 RepID=A0ABU2FQC1_9EURY|nr:hypothetical protein [Halomicroarcula sp. S3CR25-11]MDS0282457.1 hypothetical protein [Halomicroarcula sp. S3CR25-11]
MAEGIPLLTPLARRLEAVMFGRYERQYRLFAQAVTVVAAGLALAWGVFALGLLPLGAGATAVLSTAASVAVTAFVIVGLLQFLVLANVLERANEDVATEAAELEAAAERLEQTAEELEQSAEAVGDAAETVDDAADEVEGAAAETDTDGAAETATEARDRATEARATAETVEDAVEDAKAAATDVEETAAQKRERLAGAEGDGSDSDDADGQ